MKPKLFSKILLAFWLTLIAMSLGLWLLYAADRTPEGRTTTRAAEPVITLLAHEIETSGPLKAETERRLLSPVLRDRIAIAPQPAAPVEMKGQMVRRAEAPDSRIYIVTYRYPGQFQPGPFAISREILLVWFAASLLFSIALTWHLTRPLIILREGIHRLAQGDFQVQLEDRIGRRSDEIADVARDFDLMAARLDQLVKARDRLLHDVSHELRSPLARLLLAVGLVRQDPQRTQNLLDRIEREATRLERLVNELLVLARAESGAEEEFDYFDPITLMESVILDAMFEAEISGRQISVALPTAQEDHRPTVQGNAVLFRRAVENVVRNALRFSPVGETVQVEVQIASAPLRYRIIVMDNGPGVEIDDTDKLFEQFIRIGSAGVGLGLAIARRAVVANGGSISAHNREDGGFLVEIDVLAVPHEPAS